MLSRSFWTKFLTFFLFAIIYFICSPNIIHRVYAEDECARAHFKAKCSGTKILEPRNPHKDEGEFVKYNTCRAIPFIDCGPPPKIICDYETPEEAKHDCRDAKSGPNGIGGTCQDSPAGAVCKPGKETPKDCTCDPNSKTIMHCGGKATQQDIPCGDGGECQGDPGKAQCISKGAKELGKCTCENEGVAAKDKNGYICKKDGKETKKEKCNDEKEPCKNTPNDMTDPNHPGVKCDRTAVLAQCKKENAQCDGNAQDGSDLTKVCCGEMSCIRGKCLSSLPPPPSPPCAQGQFQDGKCGAVATAFGNISTKPEQFIQSIFAILLSMSGGIALLLIIKSGYLIMTAQGKPETLQQGRDQLVAAIVGLVFLIFSFVLLQVIGVDILHIPGFK